MRMRGISPVIATVIILAVTIAIAVAVIGWITGLFGATTGGTEQLQVMPDSKLFSNGTLILHLRNSGSADAVVYKVEIVGVGSQATTVTVTKGTDTTITVSGFSGITAGAQYTIKVYTQSGNVATATIVAEA